MVSNVNFHPCDRAVTQHLNITQQLDAGVRFIDFRMVLVGSGAKLDPGLKAPLVLIFDTEKG